MTSVDYECVATLGPKAQLICPGIFWIKSQRRNVIAFILIATVGEFHRWPFWRVIAY